MIWTPHITDVPWDSEPLNTTFWLRPSIYFLTRLTVHPSNPSPVQKEECCGGQYYTTGHIRSQRSKHFVLRTADGMEQCVWAFALPWHLTDLLEDSFQCWQLSSSHFTPFEGCRVQVLYLCFLKSCMKVTILYLRRCASHQQSLWKYEGLLRSTCCACSI